jgi:hypothetical protein
LIAVTERLAPHLECSLHGNLPPTADEGPAEIFDEPTEVARELKSTPPAILSFDPKTFWSTRVDVDSNGKKKLVNDLR